MRSSVHAPWLTRSGNAAGLAGSLQAGDPQQVGPYRLLGRLGAGGMGQVFLARSAGGRLVAVKVIRPELASDPGFRARFSREIALARRVSGLFTAVVVDADVAGLMPWLATAYVAGPSLDDAVAGQGPLPADSVLTLAAGLAEGLQAIHAAGLVHRDLKPSNVLLAGDGPRVIDFGISQAAEGSVLTQTGMVLGSPGFMSPEQAEGRQVGPASDVFSLGAVLAFAASGRGPFGAGSTPSLMYRVVFHEPDTSHLPVRIRALVERCLAKDPGQRPTPADLLAQLDASQPAADWLPEPLTSVLGRYVVPTLAGTAGLGGDAGGTAGAGLPWAGGAELTMDAAAGGVPTTAAAPGAPPTVRSTPPGLVPTVAVPARTGAAGPSGGAGSSRGAGRSPSGAPHGRPPQRTRRGRVWALLAAGLVAMAAATAIAVPKVINETPVAQTRPAGATKVMKRPHHHTARPTSTGRAVTHSATPTAVPQPSETVTSSPSPTPTGFAVTSTPTPATASPASQTPTPVMTTPAPDPTMTGSSTPAANPTVTATTTLALKPTSSAGA